MIIFYYKFYEKFSQDIKNRQEYLKNKLLSGIAIIVLLAGIFTAFITVANAKSLNLLGSKKQNIKVTLKNDADINLSKDKISEIPHVRIINITYRDKEWSKMVNKYDLPNMENPFKNEFIIKTNKKANINEICSRIKGMDFVESIKYGSDTECAEKQE